MSVRLATEKDIPMLGEMLANMGQLWSEKAIVESLSAPWITVLHETAGIPDGFYMGLVNKAAKQTIIGPGDAPHDSHQVWLKAICEMGIEIENELTRRFPLEDKTKWWTLTRIWPDMGPLRGFLETQFGWLPKANAGPTSNKEGYTTQPDGGRTYWIKRPNLVAKATAVSRVL